MLRGTGLAGLGGIHPVAGHIVRPLLHVRRAELRTYLRAKKQRWREDATNRDTTKLRARIRRKLLPLLEKEFQPAVVAHLATLADLTREDESALQAIAKERAAVLFEKKADLTRISVKRLLNPWTGEKLGRDDGQKYRAGATALSKRIVRLILEERKIRPGQIGAEHIACVMELAEHGENGKTIMLPGGVEVRRERNSIVFAASPGAKLEGPLTEYARSFTAQNLASGEAIVEVPALGCVFRLKVIDCASIRGETIHTGSVLDRASLRFPLVLRNWRPGDRIQPLGRRNAHKLKRLLNEKRISRWERKGWPVLTSGEALVWARGFPVAVGFAATGKARAGIVIVEETLS
jgi:tRNA(Ile)-lysidine synthase